MKAKWSETNQPSSRELFSFLKSNVANREESRGSKLTGSVDEGMARAAHKIARSLRVGTVTINNRDGGGIEVPFGGYKQSGFGRDKSLHALDKYSQLKTTYITVG